MADRQTKVSLVAEVNGYVAGMDRAKRSTEQMADPAKKKVKELSEAQKELARTSGIAMTALGVAVTAGVALAVKKFADFDQAMSFVGAATHETAANMNLLRDAALEAGARTVFSATEAANAIEELAKAGVSTKDILGGGLNGALDLAAAGGLGVAEAASIAATALKQFNLSGTDMAHVADLLAAGAGKAQGDVTDLSTALKYVGPIAAGMNVSIDETVGTLAAFASQGILADQAGTSLRGMLSSITSPSSIANNELKRLGVTLYDSNGKFLGLANAAGQLEKAYAGMTDQQKDTSLGIIFGNQQITAARVLLKEGEKGVKDWTKAVNDQGYAADTAARRLDNFHGDIEQLGGAFDTVLIQSGSAANDVLRDMTQTATNLLTWFAELPDGAQQAVFWIAAVTGAVALAGGGFLLAIPKIAQFRASLNALAADMPRTAAAARGVTGFLGGPWGLAIGAAVAILGIFVSQQANAQAEVRELADSLDQQTGALTENSRAIVKNNLAQRDSFLWATGKSTFDKAKELGISLKLVTDAAEGNTKALSELEDQIDTMTAGTGQYVLVTDDAGNTTKVFKNNATELLEAVKKSAGQIEDAKDITKQKAEADEGAADAADDHANALAVLSGKASDANTEISDLANAINNFGKAQLDVSGAQIAFEQAVDDATAAVEKNGRTLDLNTQQGRDNQRALDDIAASTLNLVSKQAEAGASQDVLTQLMGVGRQAFIDAAMAAGKTADEAANLADKYQLVPSNVSTAVQVTGVEYAISQTETLRNVLNSLSAPDLSAWKDWEGYGRWGINRAEGGILPGPPSSRDNMLVHAASGEFIVNAADTARNRALLEHINSGGRVPWGGSYAGGGFVQPRYATAAPVSSSGSPVVSAHAIAVELAQVLSERPTSSLTVVNPIVKDPPRERLDEQAAVKY